MRSTASSFNCQYPLLSLRSSSNFLRLLPRLLVTSICPFICPSITCCRRQFLRKMWPIQLAFHFLISRRIFLCSLTLSNTSSLLTWSVQLYVAFYLYLLTFQMYVYLILFFFMQGTSSIVFRSPHTSQIPNFQSVLSHVSPSCHGNAYTILSPILVSYSNIKLQISYVIMLSIYGFMKAGARKAVLFLWL